MPDEKLLDWLQRDLQNIEHRPSDEVLIELVEDAKRIITLYRERPETLRTSAVARELNSLAIDLGKAAKAAERLGNQGLLLIVTASEVNPDSVDIDMRKHSLWSCLA